MPLPSWLAQINKRVFNPMELRRGDRPVLIHTGRTSGKEYHTPLDAHPVDGGFVFFVNYGAATSDWVRNILASGEAILLWEGEEIRLDAPRVVSQDEAFRSLSGDVKPMPEWLNITEYLHMTAAG